MCSTFYAHLDREWSVVGVFVKGCLLFWLGSATLCSSTMVQFPSHPSSPTAASCAILLFRCMQTAAKWFENLKALLTHSSACAAVQCPCADSAHHKCPHSGSCLGVPRATSPCRSTCKRCLLVAVLLVTNLWVQFSSSFC